MFRVYDEEGYEDVAADNFYTVGDLVIFCNGGNVPTRNTVKVFNIKCITSFEPVDPSITDFNFGA